MKITFYGVRGSIATPGATTVKYGGNTSCVHAQLDDGSHFVFDSGTGMNKLGAVLSQDQAPINVCVTHNHWDHIQGFPYFDPIYTAGRDIRLTSLAIPGLDKLPLLHMLGSPFHPVELDHLGANFISDALRNTSETREYKNARILTQPLNHPNGGCAFKLEADGVKIAYVTDNELLPPGQPETEYDQWVRYLSGVDLLIHDAQYIEEDLPCKHGWGHSLISQVLALACDAGVKAVVLYHHDPTRTDSQLNEISIESAVMLKKLDRSPQFFCAAEGQSITVTPTMITSN